MSVTLYWTAYRDHPLSPAAERSAQAIVDAASEEPNILALMDAEGTFWEGMLLWPDPDEEGDVLRGSSALPRLSAPALQTLLEHCCDVLTALRRAIAGAEWDVALDDLPIPWDPRTWRYIAGPEHLEHYRQAMAWEALVAGQQPENAGGLSPPGR
jgi:hypothetical protein